MMLCERLIMSILINLLSEKLSLHWGHLDIAHTSYTQRFLSVPLYVTSSVGRTPVWSKNNLFLYWLIIIFWFFKWRAMNAVSHRSIAEQILHMWQNAFEIRFGNCFDTKWLMLCFSCIWYFSLSQPFTALPHSEHWNWQMFETFPEDSGAFSQILKIKSLVCLCL